MSIQTELTRIINAKAAIKTAIEGKGVTVPEATLLDGMASLIESIEAGGGEDFSPFSIITWGTYVPAEDEKSLSIPNLTNGSNGFFVIGSRGGSIGSNNVDSAFSTSMYNQMQRLRYSSGNYTNSYPTSSALGVYSFGSYYLKAGVTYWYAYGVKP